MPEPVDLSYVIGLPPVEAIAYFEAKGYAFSWRWQDVWEEAHAKAFTVAKAMKLDILQDIKGALDKAVTDGTTFDTFKKELIPTLQAKGWWGKTEEGAQLGSASRLDNIFRTNIQSAYSAGRYKTQMENVDDRPYWQYLAVMDSRTRPAHSALNGKVFRFDDPFWNTHYPPNGFKCRCRVREYDKKEIKDRGIKIESGTGKMVWEDWPLSMRSDETRPVAGYRDTKTGKTTFTDLGFSTNPGKVAWEIAPGKYSPEIGALI